MTAETHTFAFVSRKGGIKNTFNVRAVILDGTAWFVAADARNVLGIIPGGHNFKHLDADGVRVLNKGYQISLDPLLFPGRVNRVTLITESSMNKFIMRSDRPIARALQDWLARDVMPSIRKTGGYVLQGADRATVGEGTVAEMPDVGGASKSARRQRRTPTRLTPPFQFVGFGAATARATGRG